MNNYHGPQFPDESQDKERKSFRVAILVLLHAFALGVFVFLMLGLSGGSLTVNVAADGQPGQIIYTDDVRGRME